MRCECLVNECHAIPGEAPEFPQHLPYFTLLWWSTTLVHEAYPEPLLQSATRGRSRAVCGTLCSANLAWDVGIVGTRCKLQNRLNTWKIWHCALVLSCTAECLHNF